MALKVNIKKNLGDFVLQINLMTDSFCTGILGASGSGKSMLLKCIAGIETPDEGQIMLDGKVLFDSEKKINLPPQKRHIGYLFQNYALFPTMTVEENICAGIAGKHKKEKIKAAGAYVEKFHLEGLEKHYPSQLSGGQQQRVALARMLAAEPEMILLDEPFSALDAYLKDAMQREMAQTIKDFDGHVLIVSHSRDELYKLCPMLAIMDHGGLLCVNDTKALFAKPAYVQAARLTGCKNISPIRKVDDYHVEALDWGIIFETAETVGDDITHMGIRAHHFKIAKSSTLAVNKFEIELLDILEAPFEIQYFVRKKGESNKQAIWWKTGKHAVNQKETMAGHQYLYIEPEDILLLKE